MLNLVHVNAFLAVLQTGSFHAAARRLDVGQPAVSQYVKQLEVSLGFPLIERRRKGCVATRHGEIFVHYARRLIATAESAKAHVQGTRLALGASGNIGVYLLPQALQSIRQTTAGLGDVSLTIATNPDIAEQLTAGALDLAAMEWWDDRPGFTATPWRQERLVVIVPPDHPWATLEALEIGRLKGVPLLGGERGSGTGTLIRSRLGRLADDIVMGDNLGSTEAVKQAVKAGLGISLVLASAVTEDVARASLVALPLDGVELVKELKLVLPSHLPHSSPAARLAATLAAIPAEARA
ncbi:LysR family transcriptional regulator [Methyloligella solikamskensis]|uniref:LysR family transcriptional regulator n=1 Tax=Methyloligella solikamskensis TaxID=1177756 RepID=A0ABW3JCZ9_9HYPH